MATMNKMDNYQASMWLLQNTMLTEIQNYLKGDIFFKGNVKAQITKSTNELKKGLGLIDTTKRMTKGQVDNIVSEAIMNYKTNKGKSEKIEITLPEFDEYHIPKIDVFNDTMLEFIEKNKSKISQEQYKTAKTAYKYIYNFLNYIYRYCIDEIK